MDRLEARRLLERARPPRPGRISVRLACDIADVREAQELRWRILHGEYGTSWSSRTPGLDEDIFDPYCEHLVARDEANGEAIGSCRILVPSAARRIGCYPAEIAFDLTRLRLLRDGVVEVGRPYVLPDCRDDAVTSKLWTALA